MAEVSDAELLAGAVQESLEHLQPWMPWATPEAAQVETQRARRLEAVQAAEEGREYSYLLVREDGELCGVLGLHRRIGPDAIEIGYWLRPGHTGRGLLTKAAGALTAAALELPDVNSVQIRCDEANVRSAAVPRRLGYRLDRIEDDGVQAPAEVGRGMVWVFPPD